jgi:hypothetical protein
MIVRENDAAPDSSVFDVAVVAVGYERRCRWVAEQHEIVAHHFIGLEFGFLTEGSYSENRAFFGKRKCTFLLGLSETATVEIAESILSNAPNNSIRIFLDVSSMSREMIANVSLALEVVSRKKRLEVFVAYAPSRFSNTHGPAPIRSARPIRPSLAGWSSQPDKPLGTIFGLGCESGLALGALQFLEPDKAWMFEPRGLDVRFDNAMKKANVHLGTIFDVTRFEYDIVGPTVARGRCESLLNAIDGYFRVIIVPFGPKIFAWVALATVVFAARKSVGVWTFSSKDQGVPVDRNAAGEVIWHNLTLDNGGAN